MILKRMYTQLITPFGSYVFHYSTFGLKNRSATFQHMMDVIFGRLSHYLIYMDELLVFSAHELYLGEVLSFLRENGLIVRPDKCTTVSLTEDFLGHRISSDGIRPVVAFKYFRNRFYLKY